MSKKYKLKEQTAAMAAEPTSVAYAADASVTPRQSAQLQAFWELMKTSGESVQYGLYMLLDQKYSHQTVVNGSKDWADSFYGAWADERSAETIIADIRDNRSGCRDVADLFN